MNEIKRLQKENFDRLFKQLQKPSKQRKFEPWQLEPEANYFNLQKYLKKYFKQT